MIWRFVMIVALALALSSTAFSQEEEADAPPEELAAEEAAPETVEEPEDPSAAEMEPVPEPAPPPPTPAGPPPPGTVLLSDNFDSPDTGVLPKTSPEPARYVRGYADGEYQLQKLDPQWDGAPFATLPGTYGDASLAMDARLVGDPGGRAIRLFCRLQPTARTSGYFVSLVPQERQLRLYRLDEGRLTPLTGLEPSAAIRRGNVVNRVELSCAGAVISAVVNGTLVAATADATYAEGRMLIAALTFPGSPLVEARLDNLVVTRRAQEALPSPGPYDGVWSGTTPIGRGISFRVRNNVITSVTLDFQVDGSSCAVHSNPTLMPDSLVNIENNAFSMRISVLTTLRSSTPGRSETFPGALTFVITGRLASTTSASGDLDIGLSSPETDPPCQGTLKTTWTATKSG